MSRPSLRRADQTAKRLALILALELRLEGISPAVLVELFGFSQRRAVALLEGHPAAIPFPELDRLALLAHLDLLTLIRAAETPP
jgi:hypothetical protein